MFQVQPNIGIPMDTISDTNAILSQVTPSIITQSKQVIESGNFDDANELVNKIVKAWHRLNDQGNDSFDREDTRRVMAAFYIESIFPILKDATMAHITSELASLQEQITRLEKAGTKVIDPYDDEANFLNPNTKQLAPLMRRQTSINLDLSSIKKEFSVQQFNNTSFIQTNTAAIRVFKEMHITIDRMHPKQLKKRSFADDARNKLLTLFESAFNDESIISKRNPNLVGAQLFPHAAAQNNIFAPIPQGGFDG